MTPKQNLKATLQRLGLTHAGAAEFLCVSKQTVDAWTNKAKPDPPRWALKFIEYHETP